jgi:hypothetical protein
MSIHANKHARNYMTFINREIENFPSMVRDEE